MAAHIMLSCSHRLLAAGKNLAAARFWSPMRHTAMAALASHLGSNSPLAHLADKGPSLPSRLSRHQDCTAKQELSKIVAVTQHDRVPVSLCGVAVKATGGYPSHHDLAPVLSATMPASCCSQRPFGELLIRLKDVFELRVMPPGAQPLDVCIHAVSPQAHQLPHRAGRQASQATPAAQLPGKAHPLSGGCTRTFDTRLKTDRFAWC